MQEHVLTSIVNLNIPNQLMARVSNDSTAINAPICFVHMEDGERGNHTWSGEVLSTLGQTLSSYTKADSVFPIILAKSLSLKVPLNNIFSFWIVARKFTGESNRITVLILSRNVLDHFYRRRYKALFKI